jgi:hypothetical protein
MTTKDKHAKPAPTVADTEDEAVADNSSSTKADSVTGPELEQLRAKAAKADEHWDKYLRTRPVRAVTGARQP